MLNTEELAARVIENYFERVVRTFSQAIQYGISSRSDLLSDYQLGIARAINKVKPNSPVSAEQFLHYRGMCEVQKQFRVRKQKSLINECSNGHVYAFHKYRKVCPKCKTDFSPQQKFIPLIDRSYEREEANLCNQDIQKVVNNLNLPPNQLKVFKVLIGRGLYLEEEHAVSQTAKLMGLSRTRVYKIIQQCRGEVKRVLKDLDILTV